MRKLMILSFLSLFLFFSCSSSGGAKKNDSILDQKIEIVKENAQGKKVAYLVGLINLQQKEGDAVTPYIENLFQKLYSSIPKHSLDSFKDSPNKQLKIPANVARIHLKNNYPSGNTILFLLKDGKIVFEKISEFNTEFKKDIEPGNYEVVILIDRKFNNNIFMFSGSREMDGGHLYLGEFNIISKYNKSGSCPEGMIVDDDMCIKGVFKLLDNCQTGYHLVENQCCEEGFNFIMDGKCSRYSGTVETVVCPAGYHAAGKGRCCPTGAELVNDECRAVEKKGNKK